MKLNSLGVGTGDEFSPQYPLWLEANKNKISQDEFIRYLKQYEYIGRIVRLYDTQGDSAFEEVVQLVNEVRSL
jgi:hypothetical protein